MADIFAADENVARFIIAAMRSAGIDITDPVLGASDMSVLKAAFAANRAIITRDKDFRRLVIRDRHPCHGLVELRFVEQGEWRFHGVRVASILAAPGTVVRGKVTSICEADVSQIEIG